MSRFYRWLAAFTLIELLVVVAIIAILAALLLPALIAARERARRSVCLNNLDEVGKGLEQYIGQYGGYYPGGCNWGVDAYWAGAPSNNDMRQEGDSLYIREVFKTIIRPGDTVSPGRVGQYDKINVNPYYGGSEHPGKYQRALGSGQIYASPGRNLGTPQSDLKMAPRGLGWLVYIGAVPDAKVYYCPSAQDVQYTKGFTGWFHQQNARDWQTAGGFDKDTFLHGNWTHQMATTWSMCNYGVLGQYSYRNIALTGRGASDNGLYYVWAPSNSTMTIPYTRPRISTTMNCPSFKTQRRLQTRAIVSDMFDKSAFHGSYALDTDPGVGNRVHKDGYNVLYGDYHVKWYGDTEKRIIYWDVFQTGDTFTDFDGNVLTGGSQSYMNGLSADWSLWGRKWSSYHAMCAMESPLVWHTFDLDQKIDVGATYD